MIRPALRCSAALPACAVSLFVLAAAGRAGAADCALERQGEGRVAAVADTRSLRLEDGREIRLAGIERGGTPTGPAAEQPLRPSPPAAR
jgi:ferric-dicitrate binding protein FerR (iron transport regulator)